MLPSALERNHRPLENGLELLCVANNQRQLKWNGEFLSSRNSLRLHVQLTQLLRKQPVELGERMSRKSAQASGWPSPALRDTQARQRGMRRRRRRQTLSGRETSSDEERANLLIVECNRVGGAAAAAFRNAGIDER